MNEVRLQVDSFENRARYADARIEGLEERANSLRRDADALVVVYEETARRYDEAREAYEHAQRHGTMTAQAYEAAAEQYRHAAQAYRVAAATLLVAAASDAARLLCAGRMSRAEIRKFWKSQGHDLSGIDADHIWPASRGGADHPWNFQMLESGLNRALGNGLARKIMSQPIDVLQGAAVSAVMELACQP